jgi:radical SAM family uncharacterized protein/radical SAM-linked protein
MEELMRRHRIPLFSQESRHPLSTFDIIGFSLSYEMGYSNVLNMLDLGGVPLEAAARPEPFPLIIGGGPCTVNPEPLALFFDAFVVGDGEDVVDELVALFLKGKEDGWDKGQLLEAVTGLEGLYVPSFFKVRNRSDGSVASISSSLPGYEKVRRRIASRLAPLPYPTDMIVPFTRTVHDRVSLEIARGCTKGCRFCQAGFTYRPVRERRPEQIGDLAESALRHTGYEELSLLSLSTGDYSDLQRVLRDLTVRYSPAKVAVSFPSLRIGSLSDEIMEMIKAVRKTGITVAPEAATNRMRAVINKDVEEEEVLNTARLVYRQGWLSLKLYFMIGLPTETSEDVEAIAELCHRILAEMGPQKARKKLNVSISTFVPKPHTPFQWARQLPLVETTERLAWLKKRLRGRGIRVKWQDPHLSLLEGAFSRGDRSLADVLRRAHELGCRFDGWSDQFRFDIWRQAFADCGISLEDYVTREWSLHASLPWSHIDVRVSPWYLQEEYRRALAGQRTPDCRNGQCQGCAVCDFEDISMNLATSPDGSQPFPGMTAFQSAYHKIRGQEIHRKFRMRYTKRAATRFLSQLELNNAILRAFRRAQIPLRFSQGFHPMPRVDFGPALPVGVESVAEYLDFECFGFQITASEIEGKLGGVLPDGIDLLACQEIPLDKPSLFMEPNLTSYVIDIPDNIGISQDVIRDKVADFQRKPQVFVSRRQKDRTKTVDVRPAVDRVEVHSTGTVALKVRMRPNDGVRLLELLGAILDLEVPEVRRLRILKTEVEFLGTSLK